ncbi:recombinase family protein [Microbacterium sp. AGC62]
MGQVFGYARVSTSEQNSQMQFDALLEAGCDRILTEKASASGERPELAHLFDLLRPGDTVVVWRLDRLGRSVHDLIELIDGLHSKGVTLKSLRETIDTSSAGGRLVVHVFAALAEFERDLIRERTVAGLASARARGRLGGRRPALSADQARVARSAYNTGQTSVNDIAAALGVNRFTIYRELKRPERP